MTIQHTPHIDPLATPAPRTLIGQRNVGIITEQEYKIIQLERARERWRQCARRWRAAHDIGRPDLFFVGGDAA